MQSTVYFLKFEAYEVKLSSYAVNIFKNVYVQNVKLPASRGTLYFIFLFFLNTSMIQR